MNRGKAVAETSNPVPCERFKVRGATALATWRRLKNRGHGSPVVLGGDLVGWDIAIGQDDRPITREGIEKTLSDARALHFPDDLFKLRKKEEADAQEAVKRLLSQPNPKLPKVSRFNDRG